jgi:hypothetical protein
MRQHEHQSLSGLCGGEKNLALTEITTEVKNVVKNTYVIFNLILSLKLIVLKVKSMFLSTAIMCICRFRGYMSCCCLQSVFKVRV